MGLLDKFKNLFTDEELIEEEKEIEEPKKQEPKLPQVMMDSIEKTELNKDGNWYFTKDGIKVIFPKYSIACGAEGSIIIDISKNDINPYLNAQYKIK